MRHGMVLDKPDLGARRLASTREAAGAAHSCLLFRRSSLLRSTFGRARARGEASRS